MKVAMLGLLAAFALHITPTVILVKREDAVRRLLPDATQFYETELHLSDPDAHRMHEVVDWSPEDGVLRFYVGRSGARTLGAFEFVRVDTPHGPVEVAVAFSPAGAISGVVVTKATVETRPWVQAALAAGLTDRYVGLKPGDAPAGAAAIAAQVSELPDYMAGEVDKGVARALVAYGDFFKKSS